MTERAQALEAAIEKARRGLIGFAAEIQDGRVPVVGAVRDHLVLNLGLIASFLADALEGSQPPPPVGSPTTEKPRCRVCGGSGFIAQKQTIDDGYGEVDMCVYCEQEGKSTPVEPAGANEPRPQACENGDCRDHFGDELAWCVKCAPVSPVEPTPEPPQDGGNPK